jgi:hypothetical protein
MSFKDMCCVLISIIIGIAVVGISLISLIAGLEAYQCSQYENVTGKQTKYAGLVCYIQDGHDWYSWQEYKNRLVTKGKMS